MKNRTDAETAETPEQIIEHINRLMGEAEAMITGPLAEKASGKFDDLKERLSAAREQMAEVLGNAYNNTRKSVVAGAKYTDSKIRDNPYQALAIAAGVGVLIGYLVRRNQD